MKLIITALITYILLSYCAIAESPIDTINAAFPDANILSVSVCDNTAVSVIRQNGTISLCLLEGGISEEWQILLCNDKALSQDERIPDITLLRDDAFSWQVGNMTFSVTRRPDGTWGPVSQSVIGDGLENHSITTIEWEDTAKEYIKTVQVLRNGDNALLYQPSVLRVPSPWLADCASLADFDVSRFPWLEYEEYDGDWPEQDFLRDAAVYLLPDMTYCGGIYTSDECFRFVMERQDGKRVFAGVTRDLSVTISPPFPEDTWLGVENFTDWLGCGSDSFYLRMDPDLNRWELAAVMSWSEYGEELTLSQHHIYSHPTRIVIGDHPWSDVTSIDWNTLPRCIRDGFLHTDSTHWAIVRNPAVTDRLHLRRSADRQSASLGKYYNGTPVHVLFEQGDWVSVSIAGREGWMMKKYLEFGDHLLTTAEYMPKFDFLDTADQMYILADRDACTHTVASTNGWYVCGILGDDWYHVWHPQTNEYGFVLQEDVKLR